MEKYNLTQTGAEVQEILNNATPQSELTEEVERAQGAEQTLQDNIDAEELRAKAAESDLEQADTVLQGNIEAEELRAKAAEKQNADDIDVIEEKIPTEASSSNQLADKAFVNSSIASNTAMYRGSFNQVNDLHLTLEATEADIANALASAIDDADNNDYCYIQVPVSESAPTEIAQVDRYKYNGTTWAYEYTLNNSGFTADQWAALNSAITSGLVAKLSALPNMAELTALFAGKQNLLNFDTAPTTGSNNPVTSGGVKTAIDDEKTRAQAAEQANNLLITQINGKIPSDATSENKLVDKAYVDAADATMQSAIEGILALIPEAATALNQLVDKAFVNSSIATNTGTFKGTYNVVLDLELFYNATQAQIALMLASKISSAKNNDYCYVQVPNSNETPTSINHTDRYKYNGTAWAYEYTLNNSGYTSDQWGAINSGITSALVTSLTNLLNNLVPSTATAQNKLADQAYVIAAIVAAIPACKGTFTTLSDLEAVASPKAGDLGIVRTSGTDGYPVFSFYQYLNGAWNLFFALDNYYQLNKPASDNTELATFDNGMGKYEIPKHIVNIGTELEPIYQNQLYQSDFQINGAARTNTIFVIKYDFTLAEDITIPANCVLQFDGGSISGEHTITGTNTGIQAGLVKIFNTDVTLAGSWNVVESYPEWFGAMGNGVTDDTKALNWAMTISENVKLKEDAVYMVIPIINTYTSDHYCMHVMTHDLHINGNRATILLTPDMASFGYFHTMIHNPMDNNGWDRKFSCKNLTVDWNVDNNTYTIDSEHPARDRRFFFNTVTLAEAEIINCDFKYNSTNAFYLRRIDKGFISGCTFRYKNQAQHDNSAFTFSTTMNNGYGVIQNCKFAPLDYNEDADTPWTGHMVGGIELQGLGAVDIINCEFVELLNGINFSDGDCSSTSSVVTIDNARQMTGLKTITNCVFKNCLNGITLWSSYHALANADISNNVFTYNDIWIKSQTPYSGISAFIHTAYTDMGVPEIINQYGGIGKISKISVRNNYIRCDIDWSNYIDATANIEGRADIWFNSLYLDDIVIENNYIKNTPGNVFSIGRRFTTGVNSYCRAKICGNIVENNIGSIFQNRADYNVLAFLHTLVIYFSNTYDINVKLDNNRFSHNQNGFPMSSIGFTNMAWSSVPNFIDFGENNDLDNMTYVFLKADASLAYGAGGNALYKRYIHGFYKDSENFRLPYTQKAGANESPSKVPYFLNVVDDVTISIISHNFDSIFDIDNKNLDRGIYKTPSGNKVMVVNSTQFGTLWVYTERNAAETATSIIKNRGSFVNNGPSSQRVVLNSLPWGFPYYDTTIQKQLYWVGKYIRGDGAAADVKDFGTFANKPSASDIYVGFRYFCTDKQTPEQAAISADLKGIEIIHKGSDVWVDALGRVVS